MFEFQGRKRRIDAYLLPRLYKMIEIDCCAVHQNEINFCMRNSLGFDQMFDRLITVINRIGESLLLLMRWKEIVEIGVETEKCGISP